MPRALDRMINPIRATALTLAILATSGCESTYYSAMESVGIEKRDILVDRVEDARDAQEELEEYSSATLKRDSTQKLRDTQRRYNDLIRSMRKAESRMDPVLVALKDNVLYLKHNLNAKAIGALQGELGSIESDVARLIAEMNSAIVESNAFIQSLK